MYPLKFHPILKERLWGGSKLKAVLGKKIPNEITGESWEISAVEGDVSVVSNGELSGTSLQDLIERYSEDLLGKSVVKRFGKTFPILIKFIDAQSDLSIQLHPSDELAKARHNSFGKTEMWYIMDTDDGASIIVGFNRNVSKEEYVKSIKADTLLDLLNYERVAEGDAFLINTGKIHAIGAGVMLAEIQQTSDITYRIFDFNRRDRHGNLRELHTEQALDAIDYKKKDDFRIEYSTERNQLNNMVESPYFTTKFLHLSQDFEQNVSQRDSFTIYMCVEGSASIENEHGAETLRKGETLLLPALSSRITIHTNDVKLLEIII